MGRHDDDQEQGFAAAGPGGSFAARAQVAQAFTFIRDRIGEGVPMSMSWDRTGGQTFPLLKGGDWSAINIFGRSGHISLSAPGSKLPVDALGFGYRIVGSDVELDLDPVRIEGLAGRLSPDTGGSFTAAKPVGFVDPMTLWTVFNVFRGVWSLLHPQCDLTLGGNVSATGNLNGDTLSIEFSQMLAVRLAAWMFRFNLSIRSVQLTEGQAVVNFTGSRMIKSRTFNLT